MSEYVDQLECQIEGGGGFYMGSILMLDGALESKKQARSKKQVDR